MSFKDIQIKELRENPLHKMSLGELMFKYNVLDEIIRDNPHDRRIKANNLEGMRWLLAEEIKRRPKPAQVIRLNSARVHGRAPK